MSFELYWLEGTNAWYLYEKDPDELNRNFWTFGKVICLENEKYFAELTFRSTYKRDEETFDSLDEAKAWVEVTYRMNR